MVVWWCVVFVIMVQIVAFSSSHLIMHEREQYIVDNNKSVS